MDRNNLIGFSLIALLLFVYFTFFAPQPTPPAPAPVTIADTANAKTTQGPATTSDTVLTSLFGIDSVALEQVAVLENNDLRVEYNSRGGMMTRATLKGYKTYDGKPLELLTPGSSSFSLLAAFNGKESDLSNLVYSVTSDKSGDTSRIIFTAGSKDRLVRQTWTLPAAGFVLGYQLETSGLLLQKESLTLTWTNRMPLVEKDITDSRSKTAINFHTTADDTDGTSETSLDPENMAIPAGTDWVGMKQKFFLSAILFSKGFSGGDIGTTVNPLDSQTVKTGTARLLIPAQAVSGNGARFRFYLGPNDYKTLGEIAPGLESNVYLGWPPVKYVNQYFIVPVFRMLTGVTG
ncbi:MAG: membrane protein insertase YidC, partial [Bacteroidota bacterium]